MAKVLSLFEIMDRYPAQEDAIRYFEKIRWGNEVTCTKCGSARKVTAQKKVGTYWCGDCRGYFTAFTNTLMERGKVDYRKWLYAGYLLMTSRKGVSSLQLSKVLGIKQNTAWYMLHRLRLACKADNTEKLEGIVEVDETYFGGKEENKHANKKLKSGRGAVGKQAVVGIRQRGGKVKATPVQSVTSHTLQQEISDNVKRGSVVCTDDHRGYMSLYGYNHRSVKHSAKEYVRGTTHTNGIESVWAVMKRGYQGTYHHWSKKHSDKYVNEFAFRLNEGNCAVDTQDRLDSLFRAMNGKTITYGELVK